MSSKLWGIPQTHQHCTLRELAVSTHGAIIIQYICRFYFPHNIIWFSRQRGMWEYSADCAFEHLHCGSHIVYCVTRQWWHLNTRIRLRLPPLFAYVGLYGHQYLTHQVINNRINLALIFVWDNPISHKSYSWIVRYGIWSPIFCKMVISLSPILNVDGFSIFNNWLKNMHLVVLITPSNINWLQP